VGEEFIGLLDAMDGKAARSIEKRQHAVDRVQVHAQDMRGRETFAAI
jgi:hypothetical protein